MSVRVLLFGGCASWVGRKELRVKVNAPRKLTDLARWTPELEPVFRRRREVIVAVNEEFSDFGAVAKDGDEVAFMTAFSGG